MAIDCTPEALAQASKCYTAIRGQYAEAVKIYLLAMAAQLDSMTPAELMNAARCYNCIPPGMQLAVQTYLICAIASGNGVTGDQTLFEWTPVDADLVSRLGIITDANGLTSLTGKVANLTGNIEVVNGMTLQTLSYPSLLDLTGYVIVTGNTALTSVSLPLLASADDMTIENNPLLTTVNIASLLPHNGDNFLFDTNALNQTTVDLLLARCVAAPGFVTGTVALNGGTNAAPSVAGAANAAILTGRGVTVVTN